MDIPLILEEMERSGALPKGTDWGPCCQTGVLYEDFAKGWRSPVPCPTRQAMLAVWETLRIKVEADRTQAAADRQALKTLQAKPRADWTAADVRLAVQILISKLL